MHAIGCNGADHSVVPDQTCRLFFLARLKATTKYLRLAERRALSAFRSQRSASSSIAFGFSYFVRQDFPAKCKEVANKDSINRHTQQIRG